MADSKAGYFPVGTKDIDTLIPRKVPEISNKNLANHLIDAGFTSFYKDLDNPATESYLKEINGVDIEVEFLTDSQVRKEKYKNVTIAGVVAQPLSYLSFRAFSLKRFDDQ